MDRLQAMNLLKKLHAELGPQAMFLVENEPDNSSQTGCTIQFKGLTNDCIEQIKTIVKNYSL